MGRMRLQQDALTLKYSATPQHGAGYAQSNVFLSPAMQWPGNQGYSGAAVGPGSSVQWQTNVGGGADSWSTTSTGSQGGP